MYTKNDFGLHLFTTMTSGGKSRYIFPKLTHFGEYFWVKVIYFLISPISVK